MRISLLILSAILAVQSTASAELPLFPEQFERADIIAIERDGHELFGFDSVTGRRARVRLEIGETVLFEQARGRIGLVLTDRRALGIGAGTGFQEFRYQLREEPPAFGLVEDQVALVITPKRVLGFLGTRGGWVDEQFSPNERVQALRVGAAVGVVTTNRRALGLGTQGRHFVAEKLRVKEELESISAQDTLATVRTNRRILVFGSPRSSWVVQDRRRRRR
jgi:hypothetical protein